MINIGNRQRSPENEIPSKGTKQILKTKILGNFPEIKKKKEKGKRKKTHLIPTLY